MFALVACLVYCLGSRRGAALSVNVTVRELRPLLADRLMPARQYFDRSFWCASHLIQCTLAYYKPGSTVGPRVVSPKVNEACVIVVVVVLQVVELANTAYENTTAPEIKAESCFLKARVHHARGNLSEAKLLYTEACNLWPQFPPAQYGMAQMLVYEGNIDLAVKALDAVLAELPDSQVQEGCRGRNVMIRCRMSDR